MNDKKKVGVIGAGIFGILSALEIAKAGYKVVIFEKNKEIITGASLVNQCRVHMGYHYPRDERTVRDSLIAKGPYEDFFGSGVIRKIDNYYMVAKEGSKVNREEFIHFCKRMNLPFEESWPENFGMRQDKISLSAKVPENIFDANKERDFLLNKIALDPNITLCVSTMVVGIIKKDGGYLLQYKEGDEIKEIFCSALLNATYAGTNYINDLLEIPLDDFQYELCEVPVVKTPWRGTGWSIIDGPFFGVMPFGYADEYLFYDVELSVLERSVGKFPDFKNSIDYYNDPVRRSERFNKYKNKWSEWMSQMGECTQVSSMYTTRVVLPYRDKTDTRPTIINELLPGYWQVFSGKIACSVTTAVEIVESVNLFFEKNKSSE